MFELIIAVAFIAMILTPALIAAKSGKKEFEPELEEAAVKTATAKKATTVAVAQPVKVTKTAAKPRVVFQANTLPMHGTLGMAGR